MPQLHFIERLSLILTAIVTLVTFFTSDLNITLGVLFGGLLGTANFYVLRRLMAGMIRAGNQPRQAILCLLLLAKFGILGSFIFLALRFLPLDGLSMMLGFSLVVISIFFEGFRSIICRSAPQSE